MLKDPMFYVVVIGLLLVVAVMRLGGWGLQRQIEASLLSFQTRYVSVLEEATRRVGMLESNQGERQLRLVELLQDLQRRKQAGCVLVIGRVLKPDGPPRLIGLSGVPAPAELEAPAASEPPDDGSTLDFIAGTHVEVKPGRDVSDECIQIEPWAALEAGALVICTGGIELVQVFVNANAQSPWMRDGGMPVARIRQRVYPGSRIAVQVRAT